jgi:hypothetical protein
VPVYLGLHCQQERVTGTLCLVDEQWSALALQVSARIIPGGGALVIVVQRDERPPDLPVQLPQQGGLASLPGAVDDSHPEVVDEFSDRPGELPVDDVKWQVSGGHQLRLLRFCQDRLPVSPTLSSGFAKIIFGAGGRRSQMAARDGVVERRTRPAQ